MRNSKIGATAIGASLLCSISCAALAQSTDLDPARDNGIYLGVEGGVGKLGQISPTGGGADVHSKYKYGYAGFGTLGFAYGDGFRTEIEGGYRRNDVSYVRNSPGGSSQAGSTLGGSTVNGHTGALGLTTVFLNGLYDFDLDLPVVPHLGVGVGYVDARFDHAGYYNGHTISGHDNIVGYQGIAGVDYPINDNIKVSLDYHYLGTEVGDFRTETGAVTKTSISNHTLLAGVRYTFNEPAPAPVATAAQTYVAPPAPAPRAKAPEAQRSFQVFFDFDKSDITGAAAQTIKASADAVSAGHVARITVTGHTDTVGSAAYNQALSERRAEAVKAELIRDGVADNEIGTIGVGKADLLVPTKDGVREIQNRRAEIVLQ